MLYVNTGKNNGYLQSKQNYFKLIELIFTK
jgi:hypothetical protein